MTRIFYSQKDAAQMVGLKTLTLKRFRYDGTFVKGVHFAMPSPKVTIWNVPLIQDFLANQDDPQAHERAIESFLASLPSNDKGYFQNLKAVA
jgi:hypothetical protein